MSITGGRLLLFSGLPALAAGCAGFLLGRRSDDRAARKKLAFQRFLVIQDAMLRMTWDAGLTTRIMDLEGVKDAASQQELARQIQRLQRGRKVNAGEASDQEMLEFWAQEHKDHKGDSNPWPSMFALMMRTELLSSNKRLDPSVTAAAARESAREIKIKMIPEAEKYSRNDHEA